MPIPLGRVGLKLLEDIERGALTAKIATPDGAPGARLAVAEIAIPFATVDGAPGARVALDGEARPPAAVRAWLATLGAPVIVGASAIAPAKPEACGRLVVRVDLRGED